MGNGPEVCLQLKVGSCRGCSVQDLIIERSRWKVISLENAAEKIGNEYCPSNVKPQVHTLQNKSGSSGMGQRREENLIFDADDHDPKGAKLHRKY